MRRVAPFSRWGVFRPSAAEGPCARARKVHPSHVVAQASLLVAGCLTLAAHTGEEAQGEEEGKAGVLDVPRSDVRGKRTDTAGLLTCQKGIPTADCPFVVRVLPW